MKNNTRILTEEEKTRIKNYFLFSSDKLMNIEMDSLKIPRHLISKYFKYEMNVTRILGSKKESYFTEEEMLNGYIGPKFKDLTVGERRFYRTQPKIKKNFQFNEEGD